MKDCPKEAEKKVREYLAAWKDVDTEEKEYADAGVSVGFHVCGRDDRDIAEEAPGPAARREFQRRADELRALSDFVYVGVEYVDEWVCLTITVRGSPRRVKPAPIPALVDKVGAALPQSITQHPVVIGVALSAGSSGESMGLTVHTSIVSPIGRRSAILKWSLCGSVVDGWNLTVSWGCHTATRAARFKKLTPKIILSELRRILSQMPDPLDCLGHTIHVKNELGAYPTRMGYKECFLPWQVTSKDGKTARSPSPGGSVVFVNNLTQEVTEVPDESPIPDSVKPIHLF